MYPLVPYKVRLNRPGHGWSPLWSGGLTRPSIIKVKQRWARLVGGWVTASIYIMTIHDITFAHLSSIFKAMA
jgi:hypothetical protein